MFFSVGPIAAAVTNRFGTRPAVMIAGPIFAAGTIAMAYVDSLPLTYLTFGCIGGRYKLKHLVKHHYHFHK